MLLFSGSTQTLTPARAGYRCGGTPKGGRKAGSGWRRRRHHLGGAASFGAKIAVAAESADRAIQAAKSSGRAH